MTDRNALDEAAKKRIADVFARLPAGDSSAPPVILSSSENAPSQAPGVEGEVRKVIEALGRGGWRAWLIRRIVGI